MTRHDAMSLDDLLDRHTPDMSLEQPFYTDPTIFETELARIVDPQWLFVEHVSALPEPGDYVLVHVGLAISKVDEEEAQKVFQYLKEMEELDELEAGDGT